MKFSPYKEINELIDEYEEDTKVINGERKVIQYYARFFLLLVASMFEKNIKSKVVAFIEDSKEPISTTYSELSKLIKSKNKPAETCVYDYFFTWDKKTKKEKLDATKFYKLFGGDEFKEKLENSFIELRDKKINECAEEMENLHPKIERKAFEIEYTKNSDIKEALNNCSFDDAEKAFLSLKLRRNRVAHNFLTEEFSDTFNDIRTFYYRAMFYVYAIECAFENMTKPKE